jgi:hypothetical protein
VIRRICFIACLAAGAAACRTSTDSDAAAVAPPDAKAIILANKGRLWKDPDSIKNASVAAPVRHMGMMWHVCVRLNAKGGFGGYTGEKDDLIGIYDDGRPPEVVNSNIAWHCDQQAHVPFPELNGDFRPPAQAKR